MGTNNMTMRLLTANDLADILQVSKARVYELARTRAIPSITLGLRQIRFDADDVRAFLVRCNSAQLATQEGAN
jgi:excisionase family DNA binding protein